MHNTISTQQESETAQIKLQRLHKNNFQNLTKGKEDIKNYKYNRRKKICEKLRNRFAREAS